MATDRGVGPVPTGGLTPTSTAPPRTAIVLNAGSGTGAATAARELIEEKFRQAGLDVQVSLAKGGDEIRRAVEAALDAGVGRIVAGGGDGTVNAVTQHVVGRQVELGVLPLGTLNHFAKDLGLPLDLGDAIDVLLAGHTALVDVAEVNGHYFVNNSSLGLYPRLVELRQEHGARGFLKWLVAAWASVRVLRECPVFAVRVDVGGQPVVRRTPLVFVGNNPYHMQGLDAGARDSLTSGLLAIYIVRERSALRLLQLALRIVRGTTQRGQLEELRAVTAVIETTGDELSVAVDGEVESLHSPLVYHVHRGALRVMVKSEKREGEQRER